MSLSVRNGLLHLRERIACPAIEASESSAGCAIGELPHRLGNQIRYSGQRFPDAHAAVGIRMIIIECENVLMPLLNPILRGR